MMKKGNRYLPTLVGAMLMLFSVSLSAQTYENMTMLGNWGEGGGEIRAVANFGDLVYYGLGNVLKIVSFEDPASPYAAGSVVLDDMVEDIVWSTVNGQTYCFISGTSLNIVNVTNPISPSLTARMDLAGYGEGIAISGTYLYVAVGGSGMEVVDVADPANPESVTVAAGGGSGYAEGINVSAPYAYLANGANLSIFDINNPESPVLLSSIENGGGDWIQDAKSISNYVYMCAWGTGIDVVNVSNPAAPTIVTTFANPKNADIMFDGNYGYIASREYGLTVMDVSTPSAPTSVGSFTVDGSLRKVSFGAITIDGSPKGHIFSAEVSAVGAINVSNLAAMAYSGKVEVMEPADGIAYSSMVAGDLAYVAYGDFGVRILDVSNPAGMVELGNIETVGSSRKIVKKDDIIYIANRAGGVWVLDVSDPASPDSLTKLTDGTVNDVAISGNYVYAAARDLGVAIINATTANAPVVSGYVSSYYGEGIAADGNVMAQSTWDKVIFYDITAPESPVMKDSVVLVTGTGEFSIYGDYCYIHDYDTLRIYDISNLEDVVELGNAYTGGSWDGTVVVENNYAYANAETNGLRVFDITDKTAPVEVAYYDGTNSARGVTVVNGIVYVAEKEGGLTVYRNELYTSIEARPVMPGKYALAQNYPNPFNPTTTIDYTLGSNTDNVRLEVMNVLGQTVSTLVSGSQPAGTYHVVWNSHYDSGVLAPNGVYIYRLTVGEQSTSRKMILMK